MGATCLLCKAYVQGFQEVGKCLDITVDWNDS